MLYCPYFCSKLKLWALVRSTSERRFQLVPTIYVLSKYIEGIQIVLLNMAIISPSEVENICIS